MEWTERAVILSSSKHGEHHALVELLAETRGRWRGLVRGGGGRRMAGLIQPGNEVTARWRARLEAQLGTLTLELARARAGPVMRDRTRLAGLSAACATLALCLPERESHPAAYRGLVGFLDLLEEPAISMLEWGSGLVRLELGLLGELGYGLDLERCAATGRSDDLAYVSPRTGRAVNAEAGAPYRGKLLSLPRFLGSERDGASAVAAAPDEVRRGLALTGFFLERHVLAPSGRRLPPARARLMDMFG